MNGRTDRNEWSGSKGQTALTDRRGQSGPIDQSGLEGTRFFSLVCYKCKTALGHLSAVLF